MEVYTINNFSFSYPDQEKLTLNRVSLSIKQGEFVVLCGSSGCGKSTLLSQLKTVLASHGTSSGQILFEGKPLEEVDQRTQSARIGFVLQRPDNQIVTDKVWHELAFGLESLGCDTMTIRMRVAEMASFFGIQTWFYKNVTELSGGQKQLLNLAAVMAMQPSVLILDEPTSQLDPIAAADFLATVQKINRELGVTVLMTEHRLEEALPMADRMLVMENGSIIGDGDPRKVAEMLRAEEHSMFLAMPVPMRIYAGVDNELPCPITVREGRNWLDLLAEQQSIQPLKASLETGTEKSGSSRRKKEQLKAADSAIELSEVWFKYEKEGPDIVKGLSLKIKSGEFFAILGGNGTGKTTTLSLISGINRPYRGKVFLDGTELAKIPGAQMFQRRLGVLPQNPQALFVKKTVKADLLEMLSDRKLTKEQKERKVSRVAERCKLENLMEMHPYDLSGGEQQRAALAKVLLLEPRILLLDEPTKGLDGEFKQTLVQILRGLQRQGTTIVMVSHDIEFCASYADRCAMFFDGAIVTMDTPRKFFAGNSFYTTAANRMSRHLIAGAVTAEDVIEACGGKASPLPELSDAADHDGCDDDGEDEVDDRDDDDDRDDTVDRICEGGRLNQRTLTAAAMILAAVPFTIFFGMYYLDDRKYYFISMLIILEMMLPFVMVFEGKKPQARELIIIAVLCAIGVAGRAAFFMVPQFKPVVAIVIIAGIAFGGETGFLVGAVTGFVSNMFFGQGPWTPWQMFAFGIIGFLAGVLFQKGFLRRNKIALCIFGGLTTFFIFGGIMNPSSVLTFQEHPTLEMFLLSYVMGAPFDLIHSAATVVFLWVIAQPMLEKLDRIKLKYGLISS